MRLNTTHWNRLRYNLYAPFYDGVARLLDRGRRRSLEVLGPRPEEHLLVVGAGTGLDFEHLPPGVRLTAVDLAPAMVERARARAKRLGLEADVRVMDAERLEFPAGQFDAVVLHLILAVVPDPYAAIREAARVLKPGGRAVVFDKFLPEGRTPSAPRRLLGYAADALFSDINRQLEPLLDDAGLRLVRHEPSLFGGVFRIALARKSAGP